MKKAIATPSGTEKGPTPKEVDPLFRQELNNLFEVLYTGQEDWLELVARNVLHEAIGVAFGMAHLAEDAAIGAGNRLDGIEGTVRVVRAFHGRIAGKVNILGANLAIGNKVFDFLLRRYETAFPMGNGDGMDITRFAKAEPRRFVGNHFCVDHSGNMTANGIERQRRGIILQRYNMTVRHKAELDQGLEPVADSKDQAITVRQKIFHGFCKSWVAEHGGHELTRTIRFITGREATGKSHDLRLFHSFGHFFHRFLDASGVRLRITKISVFAPAASKAAAVSYSQLIPGNTGMKTVGLATL